MEARKLPSKAFPVYKIKTSAMEGDMKRIGKVLLGVIILLGYMGVICFGVMLVIEDEKKGSPVFVSQAIRGEAVESQWKQMQQPLEKVSRWLEEEILYEEKLSSSIENMIADMTLEQKLAQMMILTNENDITAANLQTYQPGGIIFFEVDFRGKSMETVRNRVDTLQSYMNTPLLVGVDEEGGVVSRLKTLAETNLPDFQGARKLYQTGVDAVKQDTETKMQYLTAMGINLNFAPVADVVSEKSSYMYTRSASGEAIEVSEYVETVLKTMNEMEVMGCIKHFPGYGNNVNTHDELAKDTRSLSEYEESDFLPFEKGIETGVDMIMVSHIVMESVDESNPASLSPTVHDILREDFSFRGVIIADDLNMQAILKTMTIETATAKAFVAGNDMIFSADFAASMRGGKKAVEQGDLSEEQINESVERILRMKIENGLIEMEE